MNIDWHKNNVSLNFQLSDKILFRKTLLMKVREVSLSEKIELSEKPIPPAEQLEEDFKGYLVRSLPVKKTQKWLQFEKGYICYTASQYQRYYIDLNISYEEYLKKFSSKTRSTIKRKIKKFANFCGGEIRWKQYQQPEEMSEFFEYARLISKKTYQEKLFDAGLPEDDDYLKNLESLAATDSVRGFIMFHGDRPIAYLSCPAVNKVLIYQYLGYDPEYRNWSIGSILHWYALESILNNGKFTMFDFTEGESEHMRLYATDSIQCANVYFLPFTLGNVSLIGCHKALNTLFEALGTVLDKLGLKSKIKRLIRFGRS